jgi:hypothetical protein
LLTNEADISRPSRALQQIPDVALFFFDVRNLASSNFKGDNKMKRFLIAIALACALSVSVFAGEIPSDGFVSPPPPRTSQTASATSLREVPSVGALTLIQALIGLLAILR